MDISTMVSWFDILQDKYGSSYFTDSEKELFLNRAQIEFVNELLPSDPKSAPLMNIELSQDTISKIAPLIYDIPYVNMSSSGVISKSSINTALNSILTGATMWRPLSIGLEYGNLKKPVKYTRHNDRWEFENNFFKKATLQNPRVRETYSSFIIQPVSTAAKIYFTVLKYPAVLSISPVVNSDLPDFTHNRIVAIALEFAGFGSRDVLLTQLAQYQKSQIN